jgi:hypothetical protein
VLVPLGGAAGGLPGERHGTRSLVYSHWHRFFMADGEPMIDLDAVEYCSEKGCSRPLVLIETALDCGQAVKPTTVLRRLAERSSLMAICVLYRPSSGSPDITCPCTEKDVNPDCDHGIDRFRVKRVWPDPQTKFVIVTPEQYVQRLRDIRLGHLSAEHTDWGVA